MLLEDNNLAIACIRIANANVHHVVRICDKCCEALNFEGVHESPLCKRRFIAATQGMRHITEDSDALPEKHRQCRSVNRIGLSNFPEPGMQRRQPPGSELDWHLVTGAVFELQGVWVDLTMQDQKSKLIIFPKGAHQPTQLEVLIPLRAIEHRRILAEYRERRKISSPIRT